jgi:dTDP-4-dehydrorhamnose reductase
VAAQALTAGRRVVGTYRTEPGAPGVEWRWLDITDRAAVRELARAVRPEVVVNAAYTVSDWRATADGAASVALAATDVGARLVHVSSDAVHAGRSEPYADGEPPTPIFAYGAAKAAAETAVAAVDPGAAIVRTSLIIGDERSVHVRLCLDLVTGRRAGTLFADQVRCPVAVDDLASAVLELAGTDARGTINVAGPDAVTRAQLGQLVARRYGLDPGRLPVGRTPSDVPPRPAVVRLDSSYATGLLTTRLRGAPEVLAAG